MKNEIREKKGIVVLLDALGVQNKTIDESKTFISLLEEVPEWHDGFFSSIRSVMKKRGVPEEDVNVPVIKTFGDTVLITWEVQDVRHVGVFLSAMAVNVSGLIDFSLKKKLLWRGAMSYGDYLESDTTTIGPAVADVAVWYEEADWFGCICTPKTSYLLDSLSISGVTVDLLGKYEPPLKSGDKLTLWCAMWPVSFISQADVKPTLASLSFHLSLFNIPRGTESKYVNALDYFNYIGKNEKKMIERFLKKRNGG